MIEDQLERECLSWLADGVDSPATDLTWRPTARFLSATTTGRWCSPRACAIPLRKKFSDMLTDVVQR